MKKNNYVAIGCNIFSAICFGLVGYAYLYEGRMTNGIIFLLLGVVQMILGIVNIVKDETIKIKRPLIIGLMVILIGGTVVGYLGISQDFFIGNRIKTDDSYVLELEKMNGTDQHYLNLSAGDSLVVHLSCEEGFLSLEIIDEDGKSIYVGNEKKNVDEFRVHISKTGQYKIHVEAHHAKGYIQVEQEKKE
ncbi:MAG: hypothetical protein Q4C49_06700 [Bacillota bacterium]|nr:hypothetical protein [Bacillota bacterium]